jgi:hypothetical protein
MKPAAWLTLIATITALLGCGADLGAGGGWLPKTGHAVAFGRAAASTKLGSGMINESGFLLGVAVESRAEEDVGSRWLMGILAGAGTGPAAIGGRWGIEGYAEAGTPLRQTLLRHGDHYVGVAVAAPFMLRRARQVADLNESTWLLKRRFELLPLVRVRMHNDHLPDEWHTRWEVSGGLAFRLRVMTDLF